MPGMPGVSAVQAPFGMPSFTQHVVCVLLFGSHFLMPVRAQMPTPVEHAAPLSNPSSTTLLQLSSRLLHASTFTERARMSAYADWISTWLLAKRACPVPPAAAVLFRFALSRLASEMPIT